MSSFPLISHHLFVAAVKEKNWGSRGPERTEMFSPAPDIRVREIPVELIDFGRPELIEVGFPLGAIRHRRPIR
jgi:hypothetical protein